MVHGVFGIWCVPYSRCCWLVRCVIISASMSLSLAMHDTMCVWLGVVAHLVVRVIVALVLRSGCSAVACCAITVLSLQCNQLGCLAGSTGSPHQVLCIVWPTELTARLEPTEMDPFMLCA